MGHEYIGPSNTETSTRRPITRGTRRQDQGRQVSSDPSSYGAPIILRSAAHRLAFVRYAVCDVVFSGVACGKGKGERGKRKAWASFARITGQHQPFCHSWSANMIVGETVAKMWLENVTDVTIKLLVGANNRTIGQWAVGSCQRNPSKTRLHHKAIASKRPSILRDIGGAKTGFISEALFIVFP